MRNLLTPLLVLIPMLPFLAGLACRSLPAATAARLAGTTGLASGTLAALAALALILGGPHYAAGLRLDGISAIMVVLVAFLGATVLRFASHYLSGDDQQARFSSWMSLTLAAVLTTVLAGHLLVLVIAWIATSLCLHRLLLHYPNRAGAVFSARKKFVISRLGDLALIGASFLLYQSYGTGDLETIFNAIATGQNAGLGLVGALLVVCAALKSAQFPFHSWLPDTMETPTPVSAFMHAGIINAGGFLIVRFSPVLSEAPLALYVLAVIGAITAAFGAVVMLAQPSVKRALAFSTIAQMGFMMLQCGLGAYGLALLHIVAHSLYKAHAFLTAGSTIGAVPRAAIVLRTPALALGVLAAGLVVAAVTTLLHLAVPTAQHPPAVFGVVLILAIAYGLARAWSTGGGTGTVLKSSGIALVIAAVSLVLHAAAGFLFAGLPQINPPAILLIIVAVVFVALFAFQILLWRANGHTLGRRLYVHALNGFYLGTLANRLLASLWPRHATR